MEKVYIKDKQGNKVLPKTHVSAVYDDEGNDLGSHLGAFEDEVRGLVDTPHQEYVTVATYASLPASGSKDTIYRVSNYNGSTSQVDTTSYSEYAWDGSQYIFLCVKSQIDEVFDITVYNNNTKYADLTAALGTGGANIPENLRKGGMSIKYVQSSDNNYVKFFCMAQNFTTDVTQWQGIIDELVDGSGNLITSGGVKSSMDLIFDHIISITFTSSYQTKNLPSLIPEGTVVKNINSSPLYLNETNYLAPNNAVTLSEDLTSIKSVGSGEYLLYVYSGKLDKINREFYGYTLNYTFSSNYQTIDIPTIPAGTKIKNNSSIDIYIYDSTLLSAGNSVVLPSDLSSIKGSSIGECSIYVYKETEVLQQQIDDVQQEIDDVQQEIDDVEEIIKKPVGYQLRLPFTGYQTISIDTVPSGTRIKNNGTHAFYLNGQNLFTAGSETILTYDLTSIKGDGTSGGEMVLLVYGEFTDYKAKLDAITGYTFTINYTSQYQSKSVIPTIPAGTTIKNVGTTHFYIYDSTLISPNQIVVLPSDLTSIKSNSVGDVKVEVYGELYDTNNKIGKDISYTLTINYTSQYQSKDLPSVIPSGTRIKNIGTQGFYIYDTTLIEINQMVVLPSDLSAIKCSAVGDVKVEIFGEGYETILTNYPKVKGFSAKVFKKVGCIGDSYTAGYIQTDEQYAHDFPEYAWPHFMSKLTGNDYVNFGVSGASAKSFVNTYFNSLHIGDAENKCQAYVIGLLINDAGDWNPDKVEPGTADDIGTDNNTYTAWYYKLVQMVVNANPLAKIFVNTEPRHGNDGYNTALKNIVDYCRANNQNVYLCDLVLYRNSDFYLNPIFTNDAINGHYTAIGYEFMAECYIHIMSDVMHKYPSEFQNVYKIPFADSQN